MDYSAIYMRLIDRARNRQLDGYVERHHVVPRCMGGTNHATNIVRLTPEEHYVAHQLLLKIHPQNYRLAAAALFMTTNGKYNQRSNRLYGWIKRQLAEAKKGKPMSEEAKRKLSISLTGKPHPNSGWSDAAKKRKSLASKGAGNNRFGTKASSKTLARMSASKTGEKHPLFGKRGPACHKFGVPVSDEQKLAISKSLTGRKQSPETIAKRVATMKKNRDVKHES